MVSDCLLGIVPQPTDSRLSETTDSRAVKLCQLSVGAFLRINTVVILLGDEIRDNPWVVQAQMEGCKF